MYSLQSKYKLRAIKDLEENTEELSLQRSEYIKIVDRTQKARATKETNDWN